jgi:shikimate kinase
MNIVLIGYRCSGKTAVGQTLADILAKDFIDTDILIEENTGSAIETIIAEKGWRHFREIEKKMIAEVSEKTNQVIATGGGAVMDPDNVTCLKTNGWIVWLNGRPGVLADRMAMDQRRGKVRPSLTGVDPLKEITTLLPVRALFYEQASDFRVDTSAVTPGETADLIIHNLPEKARR